MADYSGYLDPWSTVLTDAWAIKGGSASGRTPIWGSAKTLGKTGGVESNILGFLIDGNCYGSVRLSLMSEKPRIVMSNGRYKLIGGRRFNDEEARTWLKRHGYLSQDDKVLKRF